MRRQTAIRNIYEVFGQYQVTEKMHKCPCGCIPDAEESKVYSKPLKELTDDDLNFYSSKAMTTWGDLEHFKHFLPRLFEIYCEGKRTSLIDLWEIYCKLDYGKWKTWDEQEVNAIRNFVKADWLDFINNADSKPLLYSFENHNLYLDFDELLDEWKFTKHQLALKNFVNFFYVEGNQIIYGSRKIKVNKKDRRAELLNLTKRKNLLQQLEKAFFLNEKIHPEYAEKVSVVLQMIENIN